MMQKSESIKMIVLIVFLSSILVIGAVALLR
jgi:hypothetical protein